MSPVDQQAVSLLFLVGLFAVMYLLFIRPQTKRRREMQQMQQSLDIGVHVLTVGGLYGTVVDVEGDAVLLEVAPDVSIWYSKGAVGKLVEEDKMPGLELVPEDELDDSADESAAAESEAKPADKLTKRSGGGSGDSADASETDTEPAKGGTDDGSRSSGSKGPG